MCITLIHKSKTKHYKIVINSFRKFAKSYNTILATKMIMTYFEKAAINSFKLNFPVAKQKGCLFHFEQVIAPKNIKDFSFKCSIKPTTIYKYFSAIFLIQSIEIHSTLGIC